MTLPYQKHSETSKIGAQKPSKFVIDTQFDRISDYIISQGFTGATGREVSTALNLETAIVSARLSDIHKTSLPVKRSKQSRKNGVVWKHVDFITEEAPRKKDKIALAIQICNEVKMSHADLEIHCIVNKILDSLK